MSASRKSVGQASFRCGICHRAFRRPDHLARHERAHRNTRPFQCEICNRTFGRRDVLLRHADQVHNLSATLKYLTVHSSQESPDCDTSSSTLHTSTSSTSSSNSHPGENPHHSQRALIPADGSCSDSDSGANSSPNGDVISSLQETDIDNFLDRLLNVRSWSGLSEALQHVASNQQQNPPKNRSRDLFDSPGSLSRQKLGVECHTPSPFLSANGPMHEFSTPYDSRLFTNPSPLHTLSTIYFPHSLTQSTFDQLVKSYENHCANHQPFIHFATLDLNYGAISHGGSSRTSSQPARCQCKRLPHSALVLSILTLGANGLGEPSLAIYFYQRTRRDILSWFESSKRTKDAEPPLDILQALLNYVTFGLTFGDHSIEQLSVGHSVSLNNLIKSVALDKPDPNPKVRIHRPCPSCMTAIPSDWLHWAISEERKRTFLTYFSLSSGALTYLDSIASMDWREVGHSLPCSDEVWLAASPLEWASAFAKEPESPLFAKTVEALVSGTIEGDTPGDNDTPARAFPATSPQSIYESVNIQSCFHLIAAIHRETFYQRLHGKIDVDMIQKALQQWQILWTHVTQKDNTKAYSQLFNCNSLSLFDNTQLQLHVDLKEARAALISRQYNRFCVSFPAFDLVLESDRSECSFLTNPDNWQQTYQVFFDMDRRRAFRRIAVYAVNSLEMAFHCNPEWNSDKPSMDISPHVGIAVFYCVQMLSSWLCYFADCLRRRLYIHSPNETASGKVEDFCLLQDVLEFSQARKVQFCGNFNVPGSANETDDVNMGQLACDLLNLHSQVFYRCHTWPTFKNLAGALKGRSIAISTWLHDNEIGA